MSAARKLRRTNGGWRVEPMPMAGPTAGDVPIVVEGLLLPPEARQEGLWVGYDPWTPTRRYAGWGPAVDRFCSSGEDLLPVSGASPLLAALSLPTQAIDAAIGSIQLGKRAAVVGQGLLAALVENVLAFRGVSVTPATEEVAVPLLIDTGGDPATWDRALPVLRDNGILLLLVPPWSVPVDYDFYPYLHRRSIQVVARRWHRPPPVVAQKGGEELRPVLDDLVSEGHWVGALDPTAGADEVKAWCWIQWDDLDDPNSLSASWYH